MAVADRLRPCGRIGEVMAVETEPQPVPDHRTGCRPGLGGRTRAQRGDAVDPARGHPFGRARADAGDVAQAEAEQRLGQRRRLDHRQTIGLIHVAGDLGDEPVRRDPDRGRELVADFGAKPPP